MYSGIKLTLPSFVKKNSKITTASLDRIDSSKPYTKGNVQFVSTSINFMKGELSHDDTILLCKQIASFWDKK